MNEDDSEQIANLLMQMGCSPTERAEEADIAMLVTCSVRAKPEQKAKSKLGELRVLKQENPDLIIGVCGCMAQKEGANLRKGRPFLDLVIGTGQISRIPDLIQQVIERRRFRTALELPTDADQKLAIPGRVDRAGFAVKSFVPVMYGCDNFCSYCVVPHVRGRERSRGMDDIITEVRDLAAHGRKEVTLLGQNVNSYGATMHPAKSFSDLLHVLSDIEGIERIRFTTSHPKDLSDELIQTMRDLPKVCEHIHLAVQSGDDEILRRMNRKYTSAHFRERVAALRSAIPKISITTDFLVGFPGETDEQFENTVILAQELRLDAAFMFSFNVIPNTAAAQLEGQIPKAVKDARLGRLIKLQNTITNEINEWEVGGVFEVLVEGISPKDPSRVTGLTRQNKTMNFQAGAQLIGETVSARVVQGRAFGFMGEFDKEKP